MTQWTVDTLKQHYDSLREADKDALAAALQAVKEDNEKTAVAFEKRFDSVNEFRGQLSDQANTFLPRPEYDANHKALEDKIDNKYQTLLDKEDALTARVAAIENRSSGMKDGWKILAGVIATGIGIVSLILAFNN